MSYDHLLSSPTKYAPSKADVKHIRNGRWNGDPADRYTVSKRSAAASIKSYGFWLDHEFYVTGWTGYGTVWGGDGYVRDTMAVQPFVDGTPSAAHRLRGNATWSGDFVGFDLDPAYMTALTGDSTLTYALARNEMKVRISDLRWWNGRTSYDSPRPNYTYHGLECGVAACLEHDPANFSIVVDFYAEGADRSKHAAGVLNDYREKYAGAFAARKK